MNFSLFNNFVKKIKEMRSSIQDTVNVAKESAPIHSIDQLSQVVIVNVKLAVTKLIEILNDLSIKKEVNNPQNNPGNSDDSPLSTNNKENINPQKGSETTINKAVNSDLEANTKRDPLKEDKGVEIAQSVKEATETLINSNDPHTNLAPSTNEIKKDLTEPNVVEEKHNTVELPQIPQDQIANTPVSEEANKADALKLSDEATVRQEEGSNSIKIVAENAVKTLPESNDVLPPPAPPLPPPLPIGNATKKKWKVEPTTNPSDTKEPTAKETTLPKNNKSDLFSELLDVVKKKENSQNNNANFSQDKDLGSQKTKETSKEGMLGELQDAYSKLVGKHYDTSSSDDSEYNDFDEPSESDVRQKINKIITEEVAKSDFQSKLKDSYNNKLPSAMKAIEPKLATLIAQYGNRVLADTILNNKDKAKLLSSQKFQDKMAEAIALIPNEVKSKILTIDFYKSLEINFKLQLEKGCYHLAQTKSIDIVEKMIFDTLGLKATEESVSTDLKGLLEQGVMTKVFEAQVEKGLNEYVKIAEGYISNDNKIYYDEDLQNVINHVKSELALETHKIMDYMVETENPLTPVSNGKTSSGNLEEALEARRKALDDSTDQKDDWGDEDTTDLQNVIGSATKVNHELLRKDESSNFKIDIGKLRNVLFGEKQVINKSDVLHQDDAIKGLDTRVNGSKGNSEHNNNSNDDIAVTSNQDKNEGTTSETLNTSQIDDTSPQVSNVPVVVFSDPIPQFTAPVEVH